MAKVGTSSQDRTISLKAAVCNCINKYKGYFVHVRSQKESACNNSFITCALLIDHSSVPFYLTAFEFSRLNCSTQ